MATMRQRLGLGAVAIPWPAHAAEPESRAPAVVIEEAPAALSIWHHLGVAAILAVSLGLGLFRIERQGYASEYYAAAVKSMLQNWHAFFFASFDSAGFITFDKPPLGLCPRIPRLGDPATADTGRDCLRGPGLPACPRRLWAVGGVDCAAALAVAPINVAASRNKRRIAYWCSCCSWPRAV
jgi:hypothetical protein